MLKLWPLMTEPAGASEDVLNQWWGVRSSTVSKQTKGNSTGFYTFIDNLNILKKQGWAATKLCFAEVCRLRWWILTDSNIDGVAGWRAEQL